MNKIILVAIALATTAFLAPPAYAQSPPSTATQLALKLEQVNIVKQPDTKYSVPPSETDIKLDYKLSSIERRTATLEQNSGSKWEALSSKQTSVDGSVFFITPSHNSGSVKYRVRFSATPKSNEVISQTTSITAVKAWLQIYSEGRTDLGLLPVNTGFKETFVLKNNRNLKLGNVQIVVQRFTPGKKLELLSSKTVNIAGNIHKITVTDTIQNLNKGTVEYRVTVTPTDANFSTNPAVISSSIAYDRTSTVVAQNPLAGGTYKLNKAIQTQPLRFSTSTQTSNTRIAQLQYYDPQTKKWVVTKTVYSKQTFIFYVSRDIKPGQYRFVLPQMGQKKEFVGLSTKIVSEIKNIPITNNKLTYNHATVPWNQNAIKSHLDLGINKATVHLQKRNGTTGNSWTTIQTRKNVGSGYINFKFPLGTKTTKGSIVEYRIFVDATKYTKSTGSGYYRIVTENPNHYTGKWKTAYDAIKTQCPNNLIMFEPLLKKGAAGVAYLNNHRISIDKTITNKQSLKDIALHECAHFRQWYLYGSNWGQFTNRADVLHGKKNSLGMEHNADCVSKVWGRIGGSGYGAVCTGEKLRVAKLIASGKKW